MSFFFFWILFLTTTLNNLVPMPSLYETKILKKSRHTQWMEGLTQQQSCAPMTMLHRIMLKSSPPVDRII
jgi:hypothetical protein